MKGILTLFLVLMSYNSMAYIAGIDVQMAFVKENLPKIISETEVERNISIDLDASSIRITDLIPQNILIETVGSYIRDTRCSKVTFSVSIDDTKYSSEVFLYIQSGVKKNNAFTTYSQIYIRFLSGDTSEIRLTNGCLLGNEIKDPLLNFH